MATWATGDVLTAAFLNAIPRVNLQQEDSIVYAIPITSWRYADGDAVNATGAAGDPLLVMGGYGDGTGILQGEDAQTDAKTETVMFDVPLPIEYVAAETVQITVTARYNDAGSNTIGTKSIDCEVYEIAEAGTASADLCATAAQTLTDSMTQFTFNVTATSLAVGDILRVFIRCVLQGNSDDVLKVEIGGGGLKLDIKG